MGEKETKPELQGVRFSNKDSLLRGLHILFELQEKQENPIPFHLAPGSGIIMPVRVYEELNARLHEDGIEHTEVSVVSVSNLPPEEQAARRGLARTTPKLPK